MGLRWDEMYAVGKAEIDGQVAEVVDFFGAVLPAGTAYDHELGFALSCGHRRWDLAEHPHRDVDALVRLDPSYKQRDGLGTEPDAEPG